MDWERKNPPLFTQSLVRADGAPMSLSSSEIADGVLEAVSNVGVTRRWRWERNGRHVTISYPFSHRRTRHANRAAGAGTADWGKNSMTHSRSFLLGQCKPMSDETLRVWGQEMGELRQLRKLRGKIRK